LVHKWYDVLAIWRGYAADVTGGAVASGHYLAEEAPDEVLAHLDRFL
jgi:haloacetate dehalogenase